MQEMPGERTKQQKIAQNIVPAIISSSFSHSAFLAFFRFTSFFSAFFRFPPLFFRSPSLASRSSSSECSVKVRFIHRNLVLLSNANYRVQTWRKKHINLRCTTVMFKCTVPPVSVLGLFIHIEQTNVVQNYVVKCEAEQMCKCE